MMKQSSSKSIKSIYTSANVNTIINPSGLECRNISMSQLNPHFNHHHSIPKDLRNHLVRIATNRLPPSNHNQSWQIFYQAILV